jgi:hypothetical protein
MMRRRAIVKGRNSHPLTTELLRDPEMVAAIVNRAHRRLAGATATNVDQQQSKAARYQIERIQKQLLRIHEAASPGRILKKRGLREWQYTACRRSYN